MKISVLGSGRWGSFLAWYCNKTGHDVALYGRANSTAFSALLETRKNQYLELDKKIRLTTALEDSVKWADYVIVSIGAQQLREFSRQASPFISRDKKLILCMKGLEDTSGKRLSQVVGEECGCDVAVWVGPGHVQSFVAGIPNCMIIDSKKLELTKEIAGNLGSDLIRFYYGHDLIGNEIGAAAKNVIGIAAGMLDGLGYTSLKGALMSRGAREVSRLIQAMGGKELTAYGLSHLGDYEATLFSPHSHNRRFGELYVKGEPFEKLAEGVSTVKALVLLSDQYGVELPICRAVYHILYDGFDIREALTDLFIRPVKFEF